MIQKIKTEDDSNDKIFTMLSRDLNFLAGNRKVLATMGKVAGRVKLA